MRFLVGMAVFMLALLMISNGVFININLVRPQFGLGFAGLYIWYTGRVILQ